MRKIKKLRTYQKKIKGVKIKIVKKIKVKKIKEKKEV